MCFPAAMPQFYSLHNNDSINALKDLPDNCIDSLVTDPPAGIAFMGKAWDSHKDREHFISEMQSIFTECIRVMKPGSHGLVWAIPRTSHWTAYALENAGFEVRDIITHLFGQGFPKSLNISKAIDKMYGAEREVLSTKKKTPSFKNKETNTDSSSWDYGSSNLSYEAPITAPSTDQAKQWDGWGTALKPAVEEWILVHKPISEKSIAENVIRWNTGAINIDGCRIEAGKDLKSVYSGAKGNKQAKFGNGTQFGNSDKYESFVSPQGRFPSNLVLSHSEDCTDEQCSLDCAVRMLDEQSLEGGMHGAGKARVKGIDSHKMVVNNVPGGGGFRYGGSGGASRFFYCAKISSSERNAGLDSKDTAYILKENVCNEVIEKIKMYI